MSLSEQQVRAAIVVQAREWLVVSGERALDAKESAALAAWLKTSPVHIEAFLGVSRIARDLAAVPDEAHFSLEALIEQARSDDADRLIELESAGRGAGAAARRPGTRKLWALAAAVVLAMVFVSVPFVWWRDGERFGLPRTYETVRGEQAAWRLPDGSMLHLNTDGSATVQYSKAERVVEVNRGQALFEIVHDDRRRFRVSAGVAQVLAVGTEFDVYRRHDTTLITVVEGTVRVYAGAPPPLTGSTGVPGVPSLRVSAGQQVGVEAGKLWPKPIAVDAKATEAWLHHQIVAEDQPLGEIAEEFNRYGRVTVEIEDPSIQALRVSGRFDAYDAETFAAFLASLDGIAVQRSATRIRVTRVAATERDAPAASR
jgi:transmembrane sensor